MGLDIAIYFLLSHIIKSDAIFSNKKYIFNDCSCLRSEHVFGFYFLSYERIIIII